MIGSRCEDSLTIGEQSDNERHQDGLHISEVTHNLCEKLSSFIQRVPVANWAE